MIDLNDIDHGFCRNPVDDYCRPTFDIWWWINVRDSIRDAWDIDAV